MRLSRLLLGLLTFSALSVPAWSDPQPIEQPWLMPTHASVGARPGLSKGSAATLELLKTYLPEVKVRPKSWRGTTRQQARQREVEAFLSQARSQGCLGAVTPVSEFQVVHGSPDELRSLLSILVPDVAYKVEGRRISALGKPGALDQVSALLEELDLPSDSVLTDVKLVQITTRGMEAAGMGWAPVSHSESTTESVNGQTVKRETLAPGIFRVGWFLRGCR